MYGGTGWKDSSIQVERKNCYYDVLQIVQTTNVEGSLDTLVKTVGITLT
jgi:hypothetical protein